MDLGGQLADWFGSLGLPTTGLPIAGGVPAGLFAGKIPANLLASAALPIAGSRLTALSLQVDGKSSSPAFALTGSLSLSNSRTVKLTASGGGRQATSMQLVADMSVADLIGVSVPGLDALAITGVTLTPEAISADLKLGTIAAHATAFKVGAALPTVASFDPAIFARPTELPDLNIRLALNSAKFGESALTNAKLNITTRGGTVAGWRLDGATGRFVRD